MPSIYQDAIKLCAIVLPLTLDMPGFDFGESEGKMSFAPGDVVTMKSGGPQMTVESLKGENVVCSWMEQTGPKNSPKYAKKTDVFLDVTLAKAGPRALGFSTARR
ncbi:YodC family protein [Rhizobium bangladeshense]|uniref:YodC family protein n=1 Tax=Rhizobium bangladeshense TaxID=1138189 RepID=UPI001C8336E0|nr:DUF2158 domain-containing protein [Rhizobium bangladeshense]MBX4889788.1 DUF2158 domain-containing protein [Rhizobium bangladeshense]